jgi:hypothetical protein
MGRLSRRHRRRSLRLLLRSRRASLLASVSSTGASADSSSAEMSSRYRSCAPEVPGVSPAAMKTWRSRLPRLESELASSVGEYSSVRVSGVPSWNGSESR